MSKFADLEIGIHRRDTGKYGVELRLSLPESEGDTLPPIDPSARIAFDMDKARELSADPDKYGRWLGETLFAHESIQSGFDKALIAAESADVPIRIRLFLGPSALELHDLRWETLWLPSRDMLLTTSENIIFSRYLSSTDWRPVRLRSRGTLRALVVVANPSDVGRFAPGGRDLAPVDVAGELERARNGLADIEITELAETGKSTIGNIRQELRNGYDILYLVAHGAMLKDEPHLWLEKSDGTAHVVPGHQLVTEMQGLTQRPQMVVLLSCQSAGDSDGSASSRDGGALSGIGPQLSAAGIPAVLAMQGDISMQTASLFIPAFFAELRRDGQVDRAVAAARLDVKERHDWWIPSLFMRLRSGRLWYESGIENDTNLRKWKSITRDIGNKRSTAIVGAGLAESLFGSRRETAYKWAKEHGFPLAPHDQENLPQVAQFLSVDQNTRFPREELLAHINAELVSRFKDELPDSVDQGDLEALIEAIGDLRRSKETEGPYHTLASLGLKIYITTDPTNMLEQEIRARGLDPVVEICRWNADLEFDLDSQLEQNKGYEPSPERPLIFHLFGHVREPSSMVLTEGDFIDYVIGVTEQKDRIPSVVRTALVSTALFFVGFHLTDWSFRVLFHIIMSYEGGRRRDSYSHVAAQISLDEGQVIDPAQAHYYLENYLNSADGKSDISIFWGEPRDFLDALRKQLGSKLSGGGSGANVI